MNKWNSKFRYQVASCWLFILSRFRCSVCWCEYSKTLGKAVQRQRIGTSKFEWKNTKWKACDCKWSASSRSLWRFCRFGDFV